MVTPSPVPLRGPPSVAAAAEGCGPMISKTDAVQDALGGTLIDGLAPAPPS
jgi:hypothetical protein